MNVYASAIKLTLHKALIRSAMTYACLSWVLAADVYLLKLQLLKKKILCTPGNSPRCTLVRDMHTAIHLPHVYDYTTKLCKQQAEVIQNHENVHVRGITQDEARHRKHKWLKFGGGQSYDCSTD
jgi:hypothetical protein